MIFINSIVQSDKKLERVKEKGQTSVAAKKECRDFENTKLASAQCSRQQNIDVKGS